MLKTINRVLGRLPGPGPDCYLDQERNDLDGVVIDNSDVGYEEEQGRGQCTEPLLKGHGTDCNKYVICEFGLLLEQSCPSNLYFNKVRKKMLIIKAMLNRWIAFRWTCCAIGPRMSTAPKRNVCHPRTGNCDYYIDESQTSYNWHTSVNLGLPFEIRRLSYYT